MNIEDYKFDDVVDVVNCLNNELMQRTFANNLVDVCNSVYELSGKKVSGVMLEKSKKKYFNVDIDIITKAIIITLQSKITDKNKRAKIELFFNANNKERYKNLRLVLNFFAYIELCGNLDKTYLFATILCSNESDNYFLINGIGFSKTKLTELIMNRDVLNLLDELGALNNDKIKVVAFGVKIKSAISDNNISLLKIIETHDLVMKL